MKRLAWVGAAALLLAGAGGAFGASKAIVLPLHETATTTAVKTPVQSVQIRNDAGSVTIKAGTLISVVSDARWNVYEPTVKISVVKGVLDVLVTCDHSTKVGPVNLDVVDSLNDCSDDIALTLPSGLPVVARSSFGDVATTGMKANQILQADYGSIDVSKASAQLLRAGSDYGHVSIDHSDFQTLKAATAYGAVTITSTNASRAELLSSGGPIDVTNARIQTLTAKASSGDIAVTDEVTPASLVLDTDYGSVSASVPKGAYDLSTSTAYGHVTVSGITTDKHSSHVLHAHSAYGDVQVRGV